MTDKDLAEWTAKGLERLMAALVDTPHIEAELTAIEVAVAGTQRVRDDLPVRAVALTGFNGEVN